jgi:glutamyl-tRNA reductase
MTLMMVGASRANSLRSGRGPVVRYSDAHAFAHVRRSRKELRAFLDWIRTHTPFAEAFVWTTCQRIELYGWLPAALSGADRGRVLHEARRSLFETEPEGLAINVLSGPEAWHHLLRTACGLNSELPGDRDVVDQLQTTCRIAQCAGTVGPRTTSLVNRAVALAAAACGQTRWGDFSSGYCAAALSRICEVDAIHPETLHHVVIGGSTTSRSLLAALAERHGVPQQHLTLVYRDHHGQLKQLRSAVGSGKRLRVHSYSEESVLRAIADADLVFFGIDQPEPVLDAADFTEIRDLRARPLTLVDFNSFGSIASPERLRGVTVWSAKALDEAVAAHTAVTITRAGFAQAVDEAEEWIARQLPSVTAVNHDAARDHVPA